MAAAAFATNLTDLYTTGNGNFDALGGGAAGLNTETDFFIQGTDCKSKNAWNNAIKGLIHDNGTGFTVPTTGGIIVWGYYSAVGSLEVKDPGGTPSNGGVMVVEGSDSGDYNRYNVAGSDTITFDSWVPYVVDPNTATADDSVGTPDGTEQWIGLECNLPTSSGPTKGAPIAVDAMRYGRCDLEYTDGDVGNGYNTFELADATANSNTNRWGVLEFRAGTYSMQGFHSFGTATTSVDFRDSNVVLFIRDTQYVASGFNRIEILNSSSNVDWENISISALGTQSPGTFVHTAGTWDCILCQFIDVGTFSLLATTVMNNCSFRGTGIITAPGSDLQGSSISGFEGTTDTSPLVWNVATDPDGKLDDMSFTKGTASTHAIELGLTSPTSVTMRDIDFSGYNASNAQTDSTFHVKRTSGTVTINIAGGSGNVSYKTDGAVVTVVQDPVTTEITVKDATDFSAIQNARVAVAASDGTGDLNYQESVTITSSSLTATVTHSLHGLSTNDWVLIEGANEQEYNGSYQITVTTTSAYTYTMTDTTTPATGTITSTTMIFNELTNALGVVSDTRSLSLAQPISGRVRKSSSSPYYKNSPITATIDNSNGLTLTILMIPDE